MSRDDDAAQTRLALFEGFFRGRDEAGKFYGAPCLVLQLRARGSRAFALASVQAAVQDVFKRPGVLQLKLTGTWAACQAPRPCVGAARPRPSGGRWPRGLISVSPRS